MIFDVVTDEMDRGFLGVVTEDAYIPLRSDVLVTARVLANALMQTLNTEGASCSSCGLNKKVDWGEAQAHKELTALANKLQKLSNQSWAKKHAGDP